MSRSLKVYFHNNLIGDAIIISVANREILYLESGFSRNEKSQYSQQIT